MINLRAAKNILLGTSIESFFAALSEVILQQYR